MRKIPIFLTSFILIICLPCFALEPTAASKDDSSRSISAAMVKVRVTYEDAPTYSGKGFLIDPSGLVLVNAHVLRSAKEVGIIYNSMEYSLSGIKYCDKIQDVAVLQINTGNAPAVTLGDSDLLYPGDKIYTVDCFVPAKDLSGGHDISLMQDFQFTKYFVYGSAQAKEENIGDPVFDSKGTTLGIITDVFLKKGRLTTIFLAINEIKPFLNSSELSLKDVIGGWGEADEYLREGAKALLQEDFSQANVLFEKARKLEPNNAITNNYVGLSYLKKGEYKEAATLFEKALKIDPNCQEAKYNLASADIMLQKYDPAISLLQEVLVGKSDNAIVMFQLGFALNAAGKTEQGVAMFEKVVALQPRWINAYFNLGNAHKDLRQYDKAVSSFTKIIELMPNFTPAYLQLASVYSLTGDSKKVVENLKKARALFQQQGNDKGAESMNKRILDTTKSAKP